jgi:hypothetical protein
MTKVESWMLSNVPSTRSPSFVCTATGITASKIKLTSDLNPMNDEKINPEKLTIDKMQPPECR